jgi:hypothetical protein
VSSLLQAQLQPIAIKKSATEITARNAISSACSVAALQNDAIRDGRERVVNGARGLQVEMVFMVSVLKQGGEKKAPNCALPDIRVLISVWMHLRKFVCRRCINRPFANTSSSKKPTATHKLSIPLTPYTPPAIWQWNKENGGQFASINRPIAGATHDKELPVGKHPLQLYSLGTPNGVKVTVMLEELLALGHSGAEYDAWLIRINEGEQFGSGFVSVNPNSKIPALLDRTDPPTRRGCSSPAPS